MHSTGLTREAEREMEKFAVDVDAEVDAIKVAAAGIQAFQEAVTPFMPDRIRRMCGYLADHVTHDEQTRDNTAKALMILAGLNGYVAEVHRD